MHELHEILEACRRADRRGFSCVLATVVGVTGSTYRKPGARMFFPEEGAPVGMVSGGCLEDDLAQRARAVLRSGESETVVYDMRSPDDIVWGLGLGCNGEVRVLLERLSPGGHPNYLAFLRRCLDERRGCVVATGSRVEGVSGLQVGERICVDQSAQVVSGEGRERRALLEDARRLLAGESSAIREYGAADGRVEALFEYVAPRIRLVVFGAGSDARPLVRIAAALGWRVTVADHRPANATAERFPEADSVRLIRYDRLAQDAPSIDRATPVIVMTHHFLHDLDLMQFLVATEAPYLGFLGPRQRTLNLLEELARREVRPDNRRLQRLYGPVGIDIGSDTPEEIALAALAEVRAVLSGRSAGFLRDRHAPLHEWPE